MNISLDTMFGSIELTGYNINYTSNEEIVLSTRSEHIARLAMFMTDNKNFKTLNVFEKYSEITINVEAIKSITNE